MKYRSGQLTAEKNQFQTWDIKAFDNETIATYDPFTQTIRLFRAFISSQWLRNINNFTSAIDNDFNLIQIEEDDTTLQ